MPKLTKEFVDRAAPGRHADSDLRGFELYVGKSGVRTFPSATARREAAGGHASRSAASPHDPGRGGDERSASSGGSPQARTPPPKRPKRRARSTSPSLPSASSPTRSRQSARVEPSRSTPSISQTRASRDRDAEGRGRHPRDDREAARRDRQEPSRDRQSGEGDAVGLVLVRGRARPLTGHLINPAKGIEKFKETAREQFLSVEEFVRLGAALREAETTGFPGRLTKRSPAPSTQPSRRNGSRSCRRSLPLRSDCWFSAAPIAGDSSPPLDGRRRRARDAASPDLEDRKEAVVLNAPALEILSHPAPSRRLCDRRGRSGEAANGLTSAMDAVSRRAGLGGLRIHDLRHASRASPQARARAAHRQRLLGHASPGTTARYAHLDADPVHARRTASARRSQRRWTARAPARTSSRSPRRGLIGKPTPSGSARTGDAKAMLLFCREDQS